ncbi:OmpA family protein [Marinilongibacter aquaticus]|uniref:OmpA family protein n=1 Tax=Marinilongibacter aquaticus TaxID=2975157 RepID=UPI0021BD0DAE|nr:OmpA family protein [Marinilongibacter aquaticus]UBM58371.1 OmpA family protein [Marinilongibacter aquaticus]
MKKYIGFCLAFFGTVAAFAQVTVKPKFEKSSTINVQIEKVELTSEYTIFSMEYVGKTTKEMLKEYLNANPELKEQLGQMPTMMRDMYLKRMMEQGGGQSFISFQPTSVLRSPSGEEFKFIKAEDIPESPEKMSLPSGENHNFVVYFERLDTGISRFDLIENPKEEENGTEFWNFYGVQIKNPKAGETNTVSNSEAENFVLNGKVFNAQTDQPIAAKITCIQQGGKAAFDSVMTSRTGYYEFLLNRKNYVYKVEAQGFETVEQAFDLTNWNGESIEQNFYLEPKKDDIEKVDDKTYRLNKVYFETGKANLKEASFPELNNVVKMLKENPEMRIRVDGHTDNQGDSGLNKILSLDRAKNVRDYLIGQGIAAERIEFKGWGDTKPVFSNASEEQRKKNRRVEIVIID